MKYNGQVHHSKVQWKQKIVISSDTQVTNCLSKAKSQTRTLELLYPNVPGETEVSFRNDSNSNNSAFIIVLITVLCINFYTRFSPSVVCIKRWLNQFILSNTKSKVRLIFFSHVTYSLAVLLLYTLLPLLNEATPTKSIWQFTLNGVIN